MVKFSKCAVFLTFFESRSSPAISVNLLLLNAIDITFELSIIFLKILLFILGSDLKENSSISSF